MVTSDQDFEAVVLEEMTIEEISGKQFLRNHPQQLSILDHALVAEEVARTENSDLEVEEEATFVEI